MNRPKRVYGAIAALLFVGVYLTSCNLESARAEPGKCDCSRFYTNPSGLKIECDTSLGCECVIYNLINYEEEEVDCSFNP